MLFTKYDTGAGGNVKQWMAFLNIFVGNLWNVASSMLAGQKAGPQIPNLAEGIAWRRAFPPAHTVIVINNQALENKLLNPNLSLGPPLWPGPAPHFF